jgi:hypothetical protein
MCLPGTVEPVEIVNPAAFERKKERKTFID